jgi:glycine dehydrogenase subunit 1
MPFIPHTDDDVRSMLSVIGVSSIGELFDEVPQSLRAGLLESIPPALSEMEIGRIMSDRATRDGRVLNFIGAGAYEHHIPAAVWSTVTRGEIYTAYTPYQAEASQGTLQTIFEYQTMMAALTGMEVSNASLYDGASALAEACLMAVRANKKPHQSRILMPKAVHPQYRRCTQAICELQNITFESIDFDPVSGQTSWSAVSFADASGLTAVVIQQPNFFGLYEEVDALTDWAHEHGAFVIAVVNPVSLAVLRPPGEWGSKGADIVIGEGQPLGVPLSGGGPYFGFMTTRLEHVRQMPGRLVGKTVDLDGRPGYALTLQAREQHIRRGKATSNICTNQGLLMSAATIYLSIVGAEGLERVANASMARTQMLIDQLSAVAGICFPLAGARFHEAVMSVPVPPDRLLEQLAQRGIAGGYDLTIDYPELGRCLLICATETKTDLDINRYVAAVADALNALQVEGAET